MIVGQSFDFGRLIGELLMKSGKGLDDMMIASHIVPYRRERSSQITQPFCTYRPIIAIWGLFRPAERRALGEGATSGKNVKSGKRLSRFC